MWFSTTATQESKNRREKKRTAKNSQLQVTKVEEPPQATADNTLLLHVNESRQQNTLLSSFYMYLDKTLYRQNSSVQQMNQQLAKVHQAIKAMFVALECLWVWRKEDQLQLAQQESNELVLFIQSVCTNWPQKTAAPSKISWRSQNWG